MLAFFSFFCMTNQTTNKPCFFCLACARFPKEQCVAGNLFYFICSSPDDAPFSLKGGYSGTTSFILVWREGSNLQQFFI